MRFSSLAEEAGLDLVTWRWRWNPVDIRACKGSGTLQQVVPFGEGVLPAPALGAGDLLPDTVGRAGDAGDEVGIRVAPLAGVGTANGVYGLANVDIVEGGVLNLDAGAGRSDFHFDVADEVERVGTVGFKIADGVLVGGLCGEGSLAVGAGGRFAAAVVFGGVLRQGREG
jgi:hypothetical protein